MKIRKFVIVMFLLPLFFSVGYAGGNTKSLNQSSKIEKNDKLAIEQNQTSADTTDPFWWPKPNFAANQAAHTANQAAHTANQAAHTANKAVKDIALWQ